MSDEQMKTRIFTTTMGHVNDDIQCGYFLTSSWKMFSIVLKGIYKKSMSISHTMDIDVHVNITFF